MDFWISINIILNLLTLINSIITIFICLFILILILIFHRKSRSVQVLLAGYTGSILFISAVTLSSMSTSSLLGYMNIQWKQYGDTLWCRLRGFFIHGFLCVLYDSYVLQAIYRLCRVVFYRHKSLHSFTLYSLLIPIGSLFGIGSISPVLIRGDVVYISSEYYCQTPFKNIPAITYIAIRLFLLPILFISLIYMCLLKHVRQSTDSLMTANDNQYRRSKQNKRDLIIIRRLLVMLTSLILLGLPSVIFLIIYMICGYFISVTYRVGWLSVSFSLVFLAFMLIRLTNPLKKTFKRCLKRNYNEEYRRQSSSSRKISLQTH